MIKKILRLGLQQRLITGAIVIALIGGGYYGSRAVFGGDGALRYAFAEVQKGTLVVSVSGTGQVAASDEVDLKTKASGEIVSVSGKAGQKVSQGQLLASLDATTERRAVIDAELAVEEARLNLERATLQAPIDYKTLQQNVDRAKRDLENAYEDGYTALSDAYTKLPDIVTGANSILYDYDISQNSQNVSAYRNLFVNTVGDDSPAVNALAKRAEDDYKASRDAYTESSVEFRTLTRTSSSESIAAAITQSKKATALLAKAVASEGNLIDTVIDILNRRNWTIDADILAAQTSARTYITSANGVLSSLSAADKSTQTARDAVIAAERALELASVGNPSGNNPFDLKLLQNTLKQKEAALGDARQALADTQVRAPFNGMLASVAARRGDVVSNGATVGTMISYQKIAEISLNEVDISQVKVDQKATLTFDAIPNLTITGQVAEVDAVGTVAQGVVTYNVKIGFDTQDERVKPGMSVSAAVVTDAKPDTLLVPNSAIKSQGGASYVEMPARGDMALASTTTVSGVILKNPLRRVPIEIGLSNDEFTEVVNGLQEGDSIVTRTIQPNAQTQTNQQGGGLRIPGVPSGGGNFRGGGGGGGGGEGLH